MRPPMSSVSAMAFVIAPQTAAGTGTARIGQNSPPRSAPPRTLTAPDIATISVSGEPYRVNTQAHRLWQPREPHLTHVRNGPWCTLQYDAQRMVIRTAPCCARVSMAGMHHGMKLGPSIGMKSNMGAWSSPGCVMLAQMARCAVWCARPTTARCGTDRAVRKPVKTDTAGDALDAFC